MTQYSHAFLLHPLLYFKNGKKAGKLPWAWQVSYFICFSIFVQECAFHALWWARQTSVGCCKNVFPPFIFCEPWKSYNSRIVDGSCLTWLRLQTAIFIAKFISAIGQHIAKEATVWVFNKKYSPNTYFNVTALLGAKMHSLFNYMCSILALQG